MTTSTLTTPPGALSAPDPPGERRLHAHVAAAADCSFREMLAELVPLIEVMPVAGPPAVVVAGPVVLFGLLVAGPFACVCTLVVALAAASALIARAGVILASPYLLIRHVRAHRSRDASTDAQARRSVNIEWRRVVA